MLCDIPLCITYTHTNTHMRAHTHSHKHTHAHTHTFERGSLPFVAENFLVETKLVVQHHRSELCKGGDGGN